jgi:hypothetical protein
MGWVAGGPGGCSATGGGAAGFGACGAVWHPASAAIASAAVMAQIGRNSFMDLSGGTGAE